MTIHRLLIGIRATSQQMGVDLPTYKVVDTEIVKFG